MKRLIICTLLLSSILYGQIATIVKPGDMYSSVLVIWISAGEIADITKIILTIKGTDGSINTSIEDKPGTIDNHWRIVIFLPLHFNVVSVAYSPISVKQIEIPITGNI